MSKAYDIWREGYILTGISSTAIYLGEVKGESFKDACIQRMKTYDPDSKHYNREKNTFWGCRLFDNEIDARKSFG